MKIITKLNLFIVSFIILYCLIITKIQNPILTMFPINFFMIESGSMKPEIQIGEIVVVLKTKEYRKNDIITYLVNNSYFITHRIIELKEEGFITKGDYNNIEDKNIVKIEDIKGKVIFHSRLLGIILKYKIYILLILILLLVYVSFKPEVKGGKNYIKNKKNWKNKK